MLNNWTVIYYESSAHSEIAAIYAGDDYPSDLIMEEHKRIAKESGMVVTESCGITYQDLKNMLIRDRLLRVNK